MGGAAAAGPAVKGASQLAGAAGGGKGGGGGGVSPEQAALAQYTYGQNLLAARSGFANTGTGASTMATQAAGGARNAFAQQMAQASDINQQYQQQANTQLQQIADQQSAQAAQGAGVQSTFGSTPNTTGN